MSTRAQPRSEVVVLESVSTTVSLRCAGAAAPRGTGPVHPGAAPPPSRRAAPRAFASLPTSGAFRALFFADDDVSTEAGVAGLPGLWKATPWASKIR